MAIKRNADAVAKKWARNLKASQADIAAGIQAVDTSPTAKAAEQQDKMLYRLTESVQNGKWKRGLQAVSLEQWKEAFVQKGLPRLSSGVDNAATKSANFYAQLMPHIEKTQASIAKMPSTTLEDNINRMVAFSRGMSQFKKQ